MELNRIKFTGKITQACAKDSSRYAMDGALMMIPPGELNGVAIATNGAMLSATTILADKAMEKPFCEIAPLSAIPNWANGWMPRVAVKEDDTDPAYIARGEFVRNEEPGKSFPPFEDIVKADFPEDAAVVGLNVAQLRAALEAAGNAEGAAIAIVLDRKLLKLGDAYSGPMQLIAAGDAGGPAGISVLMPVRVDLSALRRRWLGFRAMMGAIAATIPGRRDENGVKAAELLAALNAEEMSEKPASKKRAGSGGGRGKRGRSRPEPKALPKPVQTEGDASQESESTESTQHAAKAAA